MRVSQITIPIRIRQTILVLAEAGADTETMIAKMREQGLSKVHSIKLLADLARIPIGEAKSKVHFSPVWHDRKKYDEAFHDIALRAALELEGERSSCKRTSLKISA